MRCSYVGIARNLGVLALLLMTAGCGSPTSVPEKSGLPVKAANAPATTEAVTGKAAQVAKPADPTASAANPAAQPTVKPASPAVPTEPGDTRQLAKVLDLGKLPAPEGAKAIEQSATKLQVTVPMKVPAAVEYYMAKLKAIGWQQVGNPSSSTTTDDFAQVSIGKDGYNLTLTAMRGEQNQASVTIAQLGNLDTRTLPRVDPAEDQYSCPTSSLYFTSVKVDDAAATLRRLLKADGWQEYDQAFSQKAERPDTADMLFLKKAYSLRVSINRPQAQPGKSAVQYFVSTLCHDLPAPADARHVEIQDSRWILTCEAPRSQASTLEYYVKAMQEIGFLARPHDEPSGKAQTISFESEQHDVALVTLTSTDDKTTKVKLEGYTAAFLQAMKEAAAKEKIARETREKKEALDKAEAAKAFEARFKQQDAKVNEAIEKALQEAGQPAKKTDPSK